MADLPVSSEDPTLIFQLVERLGEGSYGEVYSAVDLRTDQEVAIKVIPVEGDHSDLRKEVGILERCKSPYVVSYVGSFIQEKDLWIVMEYCAAGSVSDLMTIGNVTLSEPEIADVCASILLGLEYLHSQKIIHRDLKAGNVLLARDGSAKLADFGVSATLNHTMSKRNTVIGTPYWMSPETVTESLYDARADIWSLGITAIEMADGSPPYSDVHPMRALFLIPSRDPPSVKQPARWSPAFVRFIAACLQKDKDSRPSAFELLAHEFIAPAAARIRAARGRSEALAALVKRHLPAIEAARREDAEFLDEEVAQADAQAAAGGGAVGVAPPAAASSPPRPVAVPTPGPGASSPAPSSTMLGTMVVHDDAPAASEGTPTASSSSAAAAASASSPARPAVDASASSSSDGTLLMSPGTAPTMRALRTVRYKDGTMIVNGTIRKAGGVGGAAGGGGNGAAAPFLKSKATIVLNPAARRKSAFPESSSSSSSSEASGTMVVVDGGAGDAPVGDQSSSSSGSSTGAGAGAGAGAEPAFLRDFRAKAAAEDGRRRSAMGAASAPSAPAVSPVAVVAAAPATSSELASSTTSSSLASSTATVLSSLYDVTRESLEGLRKKDLEAKLAELGSQFRRDMGDLSARYGRAEAELRSALARTAGASDAGNEVDSDSSDSDSSDSDSD